MMDLSEIRKKARTAPRKNVAPSGEVPEKNAARKADRVEKVAREVESDHPVTPSPSRPLQKIDPIEALFSSFDEINGIEGADGLYGISALSVEKNDTDIRQWLCFSLDDEEYAIDIENIREIIKPREITDIPRVPDFVLGIISLRGIIIPVFDLKRRLRMGTGLQQGDSRIIVCQNEDRAVGLLVDKIAQVVRIPAKCIEPPPAVLSGIDRDMVEGVGRSHDRMMILLCLSSVLDAEHT